MYAVRKNIECRKGTGDDRNPYCGRTTTVADPKGRACGSYDPRYPLKFAAKDCAYQIFNEVPQDQRGPRRKETLPMKKLSKHISRGLPTKRGALDRNLCLSRHSSIRDDLIRAVRSCHRPYVSTGSGNVDNATN